jgi:signal transduction histidine kinase
MNRLWVWISVVIVGVVLIVALFPFVFRSLTRNVPPRPVEGIPLDVHDPEKFRQAMERFFWLDISRTMAVGAVVALIAGILLTRWLVAPLRRLEEGARAVTHQQLDYRVPEKGSREFRSVARSFNQMAAELEHQEMLRRNLLADVTHELRHPIHILRGNLQAILDGVYPLSMQEIDRLLEQTFSLTALADDLHELALAEAKELPLHKSQVDLVSLVTETIEIFQPLASEKSVALEAMLPAEPLPMFVDPDRIRQALGNLLGNALRYTPAGGRISVKLSLLAHEVSMRVQDTGIGISPEELPHVFDRFYRGDASRSRDLPGAGLGLPIAQALVQAHAGWIEVDSAGIGQGSTVTIHLPME